MKTLLLTIVVAGLALSVRAGTTIDSTSRDAYGANIGWVDWYADSNNGAVINDYYCSGYIYAANVGWINLGSGSPANLIRYQNLAANDFGVNNDGMGNLSGCAYGANIGWIAFEPTGAPAFKPDTGQFSGYAWSANCGWISLSNAFAYVQTDRVLEGPLSTNGLPIPWLMSWFGATNVDPNSDPDGSGMTIGQDYIAGLNPTDHRPELRSRRNIRHADLDQRDDSALLCHEDHLPPGPHLMDGQRPGNGLA
jgi:hypothetical protein